MPCDDTALLLIHLQGGQGEQAYLTTELLVLRSGWLRTILRQRFTLTTEHVLGATYLNLCFLKVLIHFVNRNVLMSFDLEVE